MNSEEKPNFEKLVSVDIKKQKEEVCGPEKLGDLGSLIHEGMGRVCLASGAELVDGDENGIRHYVKQETNNREVVNDTEKCEDDGDVKGGGVLEDSAEDESSSSSSSSSSDDDDDDDEEEEEEDDDYDDGKGLKNVKGEVEIEEGEIREEVVTWSDDEDGEDIVKSPIRSKNEVQDLPPVPPVSVTIQPHHQTLPVGVVLSIMGAQVIVEGVENHNPLNEGSILWITKSRSPLGVVDEIFGPVKNPYYIVRYNSETEIPTGIQQGSLISFVPEFADYVLNNNNNLYKKGYDASGENDEELSEDELEFSDDEKEAEYKKMLKMSKRGSSQQNMKRDKKSRNRVGKWKNDLQPLANSQINGSSGGSTSGPKARNCTGPGPGPSVWPNGFPCIQPQNIGFPPYGFPCNIVPPFMQQNFIQQNLGVRNLAAIHPQFNTSSVQQMLPCNFVQGVAPNFGAFAASWPAQNNFNQSQVGPQMGLPQGGVAMPNGLELENNNGAFVGAGNGENPNQGNGYPSHGGRKLFRRGGGRFRGGKR